MYKVLMICIILGFPSFCDGISSLYLKKNLCRIDGSNVDVRIATSILLTRSFLNCVTTCYQNPTCVSVIFDKSTHYCQMNNSTLSASATSSCGNLRYIQFYEEASPFPTCCMNGNLSNLTPESTSDESNSGESIRFEYLPSVDISVYIGEKVQNIFTAKNTCQSHGGKLVKLDTLEKHNAVRNFVSNTAPSEDELYIGLFTNILNTVWVDGDTVGFSNWRTSPGILESCTVMDKSVNYEWQGSSCFADHAYICEKEN